MNNWLKAMGFWIWGLIAIGLSLTLVSVNYRAALWHVQGPPRSSAAVTIAPPNGAAQSAAAELRTEIARQFALSMDPATLLESSAATPDNYLAMAHIYYQQKDCLRALSWIDRAQTPTEAGYQIKLQCANDAGNAAAKIAALIELVRLTNKTQYWNPLIRLVRSDIRDDRDTLLLYRIMYAVRAMGIDSDYLEMAQLLADAGLYQESQIVLASALSAGMVKEEHLPRLRGLQEKNAARSAVHPGGSDESSATARPFDAATRDEFLRVVDDPNVDRRVVELWQLYADTRL